MQILQWLFKIANEPQSESTNHFPSPGAAGKTRTVKGEKVKSNPPNTDRRRRKRRAEESYLVCKNLNFFKILHRKDIAKACFYSSLNLRRPAIFNRRQHLHSMKMKIMGGNNNNNQKTDSIASHVVGNKVLPISDQTSVSSSTNDQCGTNANMTEKKEKSKGDHRTKTISKMKELLRWAAAANKSEKGGNYLSRKMMHFRTKSTLKSIPADDQLSNDSPKISFRWDLESCSTTTSSAYSVLSMPSSTKNVDQTMTLPSLSSTPLHNIDYHPPRMGNWITTDSEFVVLEL